MEPQARSGGPRALEVLLVFTRLGVGSFGGPVAHLGYFREELVRRRGWASEEQFADLVALCQFLPGPASSQVAFALGLGRAGWAGGLAAWAGFTLPSALLLFAFARTAFALSGPRWAGALHGLELVAVAIVAQAVLGMAKALCPDRQRAAIALGAALLVLTGFGPGQQLCAIGLGALAGLVLCGGPAPAPVGQLATTLSRRAGLTCLGLFFALLALLPAAARLWPGGPLPLADSFYRAGALVFGGGHVVLPLLRGAVVEPGLVSDGSFLAGYGAAQAVPGPLFSFAAFLGAAARPAAPLAGALLALLALFLPGLLVLAGALPFWDQLRRRPAAQSALRGVNAAVVGLLGVALYDPVFTGAVHDQRSFALALAGFVALGSLRAPPLLVVLLGAAAGALLG
jgi:chromate transporter